MFFHELGHIDPHNGLLRVEDKLRNRFGEFGFSDTSGPHEYKRTDGSFGISQPRSCPADGVCDTFYCLDLSDDPPPQIILHSNQFIPFPLQHPGNGDTCPSCDHRSDIFSIHLLFEHLTAFLYLGQRCFGFCQLIVQVGQLTVPDFRHPGQVPLAFRLLLLDSNAFPIFLEFTQCLDQVFFILPVRFHFKEVFIHCAKIRFQLVQAIDGSRILFPFECLALNFGLGYFSLNFVYLYRHAVDLDAELGSALIDQVDGFVRQKTV